MRNLTAIAIGGFVSGTLDIIAAFASYVSQGATVEGILKYIASGMVGPSAMQGGIGFVWLGLAVHFALTTIMAAIFLFAALKIKSLTAHPWWSGAVYGVITWAAMVYIIVPHSGVPGWKLPQNWNIVSGVMSHIFYVGVPIAHITQYALRRSKTN